MQSLALLESDIFYTLRPSELALNLQASVRRVGDTAMRIKVTARLRQHQARENLKFLEVR